MVNYISCKLASWTLEDIGPTRQTCVCDNAKRVLGCYSFEARKNLEGKEIIKEAGNYKCRFLEHGDTPCMIIETLNKLEEVLSTIKGSAENL